MKKIFVLFTSAFLCLLLTGCSLNKQESNEITLDIERLKEIYEVLADYTYGTIRENGYKSFGNQELFNIATLRIHPSDITFVSNKNNVNYYAISKKTFVNYLIPIFGEDVDFNPHEVYSGEISFLQDMCSLLVVESYDDETETFLVYFGGIGGKYVPWDGIERRKLKTMTIVNDEVILKEKAIYVEEGYIEQNGMVYGGVHFTIYSNPEKRNSLLDKQVPSENMSLEHYSVDDYLENAYTITHTFKKGKDGQYFFAGSTYR